MSNLLNVVQKVIADFINNEMLFTAVDVTNKVKETLPFARHREVRDLVRAAFHTDIEIFDYARTPINVTLSDGSTAEALLYHPLSDSWDLDNSYSTQQRAQTTAMPIPAPKVSVPVISTLAQTSAAVTPVIQAVTPTPLAAKDVWENLFQTQPSLFSK